MLLTQSVNPAFVTALGMGTVFVGLICIVILCTIMSAVVRSFAKPAPAKTEPVQKTMQQIATANKTVIANKQEFVAAVSAAIAEDMGADINGIRIHSVKKL